MNDSTIFDTVINLITVQILVYMTRLHLILPDL